MMKVGFIGLGAMGAPMARNLAKGGLLYAVWDRTPATAQALAAELGVIPAASPAALAEDSEVVVLSVSRDEDVLAVVAALAPGLGVGTVVVDTSTVSAATAREAARRVEACGSAFLDCPVSGGVEGARLGTLAMMVGGDPAALGIARPALAAMGANIVHLGPVGAGQATKAVNQIMAAGIALAVTEALAFGAGLGLDMELVIDVVGSGAAGNWFLNHRGRTMVAGTYTPGFKVELHHKDLLICQAMAEDRHPGARLPVVEQALTDYARLMAEGRGQEDISSLYCLKRREQGGV